MRTMRRSVVAVAAAALLSLSACSSSGSSSARSESGISIKHAFGTTVVPDEVDRVATIAWANQDVPLALGVKPVGFAKQTWGVEDNSGMLPWTKDAVAKLGGDTPKLWDETDSIDFEAVAASNPDVILAAYSGITKEDYEKLSKIAPTVAYPTAAWSTSWRDTITMDATAMGKAKEGEALVKKLDEQIATEVAKYPQLSGKSAAFFYATLADTNSIGYYTTADPRTAFLKDLGMNTPASVEAASKDAGKFYVDISSENVDALSDVDIVVVYGEEADLAKLQADPLLGTIPAIKRGSVVFVGNGSAFSASTTPSALSIPWGVADYVAKIAQAADKVQ